MTRGVLQTITAEWALCGGALEEGAARRRLLVADDSPVMRRMLEAMLGRWGFEVVSAADGHQAWRLLNGSFPPPLASLDWMMPGLSGPELCRRVRNRTEPPYIYVILLTGRSERADIVKGLEAGADDYVAKPFDAAELEVRLRAGWRVVEQEQRLGETRDELERLAARDPLTGVFNRRAILEQLEQALASARLQGSRSGRACRAHPAGGRIGAFFGVGRRPAIDGQRWRSHGRRRRARCGLAVARRRLCALCSETRGAKPCGNGSVSWLKCLSGRTSRNESRVTPCPRRQDRAKLAPCIEAACVVTRLPDSPGGEVVRGR